MTGRLKVGSASGRLLQAHELGATAQTAARALLGAIIVRRQDCGLDRAVIVETEAYRQDDPASHSFVGPTARNASMFGPPGRAYVYRSYGVHWCLNVVAESEGTGAGVLLRAARLLTDPSPVRLRRSTAADDAHLLRGPGCLTRGLAIDRERHDGTVVCADNDAAVGATVGGGSGPAPNSELWVEVDDRWPLDDGVVDVGPRVGVSRAADVLWRWWIRGDPAVSAYRRSPRV